MHLSRFTVLTFVLSLFLNGLGALSIAEADVYKFVDSQGRIYLTDRPPHEGYQLVLRSGKRQSAASRVDYRNKERNRQRFAMKIAAIAQRHGLPNSLIHAVIDTESAYDPNAVSRAGAVGLMQLMPETARRYGVTNRRDPDANLSGGVRYLRYLLDRFDNDLALALAGYNAGENAVEKFGNQIPPYDETQAYVRKVIKKYEQYSARSPGDA